METLRKVSVPDRLSKYLEKSGEFVADLKVATLHDRLILFHCAVMNGTV